MQVRPSVGLHEVAGRAGLTGPSPLDGPEGLAHGYLATWWDKRLLQGAVEN